MVEFFNHYLTKRTSPVALQYLQSHNIFFDGNVFSSEELVEGFDKFLDRIAALTPDAACSQTLFRFIEGNVWPFFLNSPFYFNCLLCEALCDRGMDFERLSINVRRVEKHVRSVAGINAFMEFMASRKSIHVCNFWLDATRYSLGIGSEFALHLINHRFKEYFRSGTEAFLGDEIIRSAGITVFTTINDEVIENVRNITLKVLREYWLPAYLYHCLATESEASQKSGGLFRPMTAAWLSRAPGFTRPASSMRMMEKSDKVESSNGKSGMGRMLSVPVLPSRTVVVEPTFRFEIREDFGSATTFGLAYDPGAYLKDDDIKRRQSDVFSMEFDQIKTRRSMRRSSSSDGLSSAVSTSAQTPLQTLPRRSESFSSTLLSSLASSNAIQESSRKSTSIIRKQSTESGVDARTTLEQEAAQRSSLSRKRMHENMPALREFVDNASSAISVTLTTPTINGGYSNLNDEEVRLFKEALAFDSAMGEPFLNFLYDRSDEKLICDYHFFQIVESFRDYASSGLAKFIFREFCTLEAPRTIVLTFAERNKLQEGLVSASQHLFDFLQDKAATRLMSEHPRFIADASFVSSYVHAAQTDEDFLMRQNEGLKVVDETIKAKEYLALEPERVIRNQCISECAEDILVETLASMYEGVIAESCWELDEGIDNVVTSESELKNALIRFLNGDASLEKPFRAFLLKQNAMDLLTFWCDVKEFLAIATMKLKARDIRAKSIYHSYRFSTNIKLRETTPRPGSRAEIDVTKGHAFRPSTPFLEETQAAVEKDFMERWVPMFYAMQEKLRGEKTLEDAYLAMPRPYSQGRERNRQGQDILRFQHLLNDDLSKDMERFKTFLLAQEKSIILLRDLEFYFEIQRYKRLCHSHGNIKIIQNKMAAIISCFLDSRVPPQVQVDVSMELAKTIRDESADLSLTPSPYTFRVAETQIFDVLFAFYPSFCGDEKEKESSRRSSIVSGHRKSSTTNRQSKRGSTRFKLSKVSFQISELSENDSPMNEQSSPIRKSTKLSQDFSALPDGHPAEVRERRLGSAVMLDYREPEQRQPPPLPLPETSEVPVADLTPKRRGSVLRFSLERGMSLHTISGSDMSDLQSRSSSRVGPESAAANATGVLECTPTTLSRRASLVGFPEFDDRAQSSGSTPSTSRMPRGSPSKRDRTSITGNTCSSTSNINHNNSSNTLSVADRSSRSISPLTPNLPAIHES